MGRESGSQGIVGKDKRARPRTSLGAQASKTRPERKRVGALADNAGRHEVVPGLASQARGISVFSSLSLT